MDAVRKYLPIALAIFLTFVLGYMGFLPKLLGWPPSLYMFGYTLPEETDISLWEPIGRYAIGIFELLTIIVLWLPGKRHIGGLMTMVLMIGAVISHLLWIGISTNFPAEGETPPFGPNTVTTEDGGTLFAMAVLSLLIGAYLYFRGRQTAT